MFLNCIFIFNLEFITVTLIDNEIYLKLRKTIKIAILKKMILNILRWSKK